MKSWLPTTLLLLYFTYYVFAIQDIELDPWSVGELMTARTLPSIVGSSHLQFHHSGCQNPITATAIAIKG